jgi:hypothetical protein
VVTPPLLLLRRWKRCSPTTGEIQAPTSGKVLRVGDTFGLTHKASAFSPLLCVCARKVRFEPVDFFFQDCDDVIGRLLPGLCVFLDFTHPLALPFVKCVRELTGDAVEATQELGYVSSPFRISPGRRDRPIKRHKTLTALTFFPFALAHRAGWPCGDPPALCRGEVPCPNPAEGCGTALWPHGNWQFGFGRPCFKGGSESWAASAPRLRRARRKQVPACA